MLRFRTLGLLLNVVLLAFSPAPGAAQAGDPESDARATRIRQETTNSRTSPPTTEVMITILGRGALRLDTELDAEGAPLVSTIFRVEQDSFLILLHDTQEAAIQDREQLRVIAERRQALEKRLEERLAEDPTGEAAAHARMLELRKETARLEAQKDPKGKPAGVRFEKTSESGELLGYPWNKYRQVRDGLLVQELLVTPWPDLGLGDEAALVFERMSRFVEDAMEIAGGVRRMENPYEPYLELGGFPLVIRYFNPQGESVAETRAVSIETVAGNGVFENPGYPEKGIAEDLPELE
ncbi:MAG: hypothetical protein WBP34_10815 [Thermoanaerobaculia bacterium]